MKTHTLEIKKRGIIRETDSILLDGKAIIRRLDLGFKVYTFPIPDGPKRRTADLCVTSDTAGKITEVRLIVNGRVLYQESYCKGYAYLYIPIHCSRRGTHSLA
jgi:hypothetical protein